MEVQVEANSYMMRAMQLFIYGLPVVKGVLPWISVLQLHMDVFTHRKHRWDCFETRLS